MTTTPDNSIHRRGTVSELGHDRAVCVECETTWPCTEFVKDRCARLDIANGLPCNCGWHVAHVHTADCLGGNELDELCCVHLDGAALAAADRYVVTIDGGTMNVFAPTADDALALAAADGHPGTAAVRTPTAWL